MTVELFPAIDLRGGQVVRLSQGVYGRETVYGTDPRAVARAFADDGATWIHIVDLDAARGDGPVNRDVIAGIVAALNGRALVQTGGGVRTIADARAHAEAGVARVVMGSAAVRAPSLVSVVADVLPVAVGLDHRSGRVATDGWLETSELTVTEALALFPDASAFVITDISKDGMLEGPDLTGLNEAARSTSIPVIASGGVSSLDDVRELASIPGLGGIITGRAVYEGRFTVAEARAAIEVAER